MLALWGAYERQNLVRQVDASRKLAIGASPEEVISALGSPNLFWDKRAELPSFLFGHRPRQWIYGTTVDLDWVTRPDAPIPNPIPFKFRLLVSDDEDLVVDWGDDNKVSGIHRPDLRPRAKSER